MIENADQFEQRKKDHLRIALDNQVQARGLSGLEKIDLLHNALPEVNYSDIQISSDLFGTKLSSPVFISSMTAGHHDGIQINRFLARISHERQIMMGVGSQRRELNDIGAASEWKVIRRETPRAILVGNIGLPQVIQNPTESIQRLVDSVEAKALFVHLNVLQECLQPEGTRDFRGGLLALEKLIKNISVPVVVKETGCGLSPKNLRQMIELGVAAIDCAGLGGTHWGRVEGLRSSSDSVLFQVAETFANWGVSTADSVIAANRLKSKIKFNTEIWASGGVRTGLDVAKLIAMGCKLVGMAKPFLAAAVESIDRNSDVPMNHLIEKIETELKVALMCTGMSSVTQLRESADHDPIWILKNSNQREQYETTK